MMAAPPRTRPRPGPISPAQLLRERGKLGPYPQPPAAGAGEQVTTKPASRRRKTIRPAGAGE